MTFNKQRLQGMRTVLVLVMFGPEGFREAPRNHRLVIVMGTSPDTVERAFASALDWKSSLLPWAWA